MALYDKLADWGIVPDFKIKNPTSTAKETPAAPAVSDDKAKDTKRNKTPARASNKPSAASVVEPTLPGGSGNNRYITSSVFQKENEDDNVNIRRYNPLSKFVNYTYNLTLYMVGKDAVNKFYDAIDNGAQPNPHSLPGIYVVAKSGGINNKEERRALTLSGDIRPNPPSEEGFDYYIDNLHFETLTPGNAGSSLPTHQTTFNFKITEPNSYSFIPALKHAATKIMRNDLAAKLIKEEDIDPLKMAYMIGIKFYGYDVHGNIIGADQVPRDPGNAITESNALYERFYPIYLTDLTYKLAFDAVTVYDVSAISFPLQAYTENYNAIPNKLSIKGSTVREVFTGLTAALNKIQESQLKDNKRGIANRYKIEFADNAADIGDARFNIAPSQATSPATGGNKKPTPAEGQRAQTYDVGTRAFNFEPTPITKIIESVITASTYLSDCVSLINDNKLQTLAKKKAAAKDFTWYTIVPKVLPLKGFDKKTQQPAYEITYVINKQYVPMVKSNYIESTTKFYGPSKIYDYYYTGKNTEVKSLDFDFKTSFFVQTPNTPGKESDKNSKKIASTPTGAVTADSTHLQNNEFAFQKSLLTSLYNVVDNATLNMTIMGDPDFIITQLESPTKTNKYYGIYNPINKQIFIELRLRGAVDYSHENGLMTLGPMASGYKDERLRAELRKFHERNNPEDRNSDKDAGIIYRSIRINSNFVGGLFTQDIQDAVLFEEGLLKANLGILDPEEQRAESDKKTESDSNRAPSSAPKNPAAKPPAKPKQESSGYDPNKFQDDNTKSLAERWQLLKKRREEIAKYDTPEQAQAVRDTITNDLSRKSRTRFDRNRTGPL